jgi:secreted trypsin-like serine protease
VQSHGKRILAKVFIRIKTINGIKFKIKSLGDSGGPVTYPQLIHESTRAVQYGIVSYGPYCGTGPGVYTKVNSFVRWILDNADFE